jgi:hypothetical protein
VEDGPALGTPADRARALVHAPTVPGEGAAIVPHP